MMNDSAPPAVPVKARFMQGLSRNYAALHTFVRNLLGDSEEARDIVQEVFIEAWRVAQCGQAPFAEGSSDADARRWLFRAAYHRAISLQRHRRVIAWESLDAVGGPERIERDAATPFEEQLAEGEALRAALDRLDAREAACVLLKFVHGFSAVEIARILGVAPDAVRKRLSRAMQRLRAAYFAQESVQAGSTSTMQTGSIERQQRS